MNCQRLLTPFVGLKLEESVLPLQVLGLHSQAGPNRQVYLSLSSRCRWARGTFFQCSYGKWGLSLMFRTNITAFAGCHQGRQTAACPSWDHFGNASGTGFLQTSMPWFPAY